MLMVLAMWLLLLSSTASLISKCSRQNFNDHIFACFRKKTVEHTFLLICIPLFLPISPLYYSCRYFPLLFCFWLKTKMPNDTKQVRLYANRNPSSLQACIIFDGRIVSCFKIKRDERVTFRYLFSTFLFLFSESRPRQPRRWQQREHRHRGVDLERRLPQLNDQPRLRPSLQLKFQLDNNRFVIPLNSSHQRTPIPGAG